MGIKLDICRLEKEVVALESSIIREEPQPLLSLCFKQYNGTSRRRAFSEKNSPRNKSNWE